MKIAVNARFLLKGKLEGIGWYSFEVLRRLVAMRPEDEFIFFFDRAYDEAFIFADNVSGVVVAPPARHPFLWYLWFEWAIPRQLKKYQADIFISPDGYCSLSTDTPTLMVVHDIAHHHFPEQVPFLVRSYYNYFVPRYLRKAKKILTVSEYTQSDIIKTYGIRPEKIRVAPNGCRDSFQPISDKQKKDIRSQFSEGQPYFFYAGAVHPRKNVHRVITAFDQFKKRTKSPIKLLIGGRFAWQTGPVKTAFNEATHQSDIHFPGYLEDEVLPLLTAAAIAMVYPSQFEGFGLPVLEAMQAGTPVITSNVSSLPEVCGDAGILVSPTDIEAISYAMEKVYTDKNLAREMSQKGLLRSQKFSWDQTAKAMSEVLSTPPA